MSASSKKKLRKEQAPEKLSQKQIAAQKEASTTRLYTIMSVLDSLSRAIPVPVRVNYGHMLNDPTKTEGHYVILLGFEGDHAVIVDSSAPDGIYECPIQRFLESMVMDTKKGLTCAWNAVPLLNENQF